MSVLRVMVGLVSVVGACACSSNGQPPHLDAAKPEKQIVTSAANPASIYCVDQGYELVRVELELSAIEYCVDPDSDRKCRVWPFQRGECQLPKRR